MYNYANDILRQELISRDRAGFFIILHLHGKKNTEKSNHKIRKYIYNIYLYNFLIN